MNEKINAVAAKKSLRAVYRQKRAVLTASFMRDEDRAICRAILESPEYENADTVLLYYPVGNEINVLDVFFAAVKDGKRVAFPRCIRNGDEKYMVFHYVKALDELEGGEYNIPCPTAEAETATPTERTVCTVPALVYDKNGYRIGYGGGYYDRFLSDFKGKSVGVYRTGFLHGEDLPRESTDKKCSHLASREGVRRLKGE